MIQMRSCRHVLACLLWTSVRSTTRSLTHPKSTANLYGFPFKPRLVARSNPDVGEKPTRLQAYLKHKEIIPLGAHPLTACYLEDTLAPSLEAYLLSLEVQVSLLNSSLIGVVGEASSPSSWSESSTTLSLARPAWMPHWGADPSLSRMVSTRFMSSFSSRYSLSSIPRACISLSSPPTPLPSSASPSPPPLVPCRVPQFRGGYRRLLLPRHDQAWCSLLFNCKICPIRS